MLIDEAAIVAAKVGGAAAFGSALALKSFPGTKFQRFCSFVGSVVIGCLVGGAAVERFGLLPGSYTHMLVVATSSVFGLAIVHHAMLQIPEWLNAARNKILGS